MKTRIIIFLIISLTIFTGCIKNNNQTQEKNKKETSELKMTEIKVIIDNRTYKLNLENNQTVEEFINILPQEYMMNELNGNEKYVYINESLTTNIYQPKKIEKGDVMLYGDNCLVIFYESFETSYRYTKIGHIDNLPDLGKENIKISFEK